MIHKLFQKSMILLKWLDKYKKKAENKNKINIMNSMENFMIRWNHVYSFFD